MRDPLTPATLAMWAVAGAAAVVFQMTRSTVLDEFPAGVMEVNERAAGRVGSRDAPATSMVTGVVRALREGRLVIERREASGVPGRRHAFRLPSAAPELARQAVHIRPGDVVTVVYERSTETVLAVRVIAAVTQD